MTRRFLKKTSLAKSTPTYISLHATIPDEVHHLYEVNDKTVPTVYSWQCTTNTGDTN